MTAGKVSRLSLAVAGVSLITASVDHFVLHSPFAAGLLKGLGIYGGVVVLLLVLGRPKRQPPGGPGAH